MSPLVLKESSGNVFLDLNVKDPEIALLKSEIAVEIRAAIARKGITQKEVGKILGVQPIKVSNIVCGRLSGYTLDRLMGYLQKLDVDLEIKLKEKPKSRKSAKFTVVHA